MKTLRRDISYNLACSILTANHYPIDTIKHYRNKDNTVITAFLNKDGKTIARYIEKYGKLQVIS